MSTIILDTLKILLVIGASAAGLWLTYWILHIIIAFAQVCGRPEREPWSREDL